MNTDVLIQISDFFKTREVKESHIRELWGRGGYFSSSGNSGCDTALYLRFEFKEEMSYNELSIEKVNNNINRRFRPFRGWETQNVNSLPEDWNEIYLCDTGYHAKFGRKGKLIARNNHDGTAQMFRI